MPLSRREFVRVAVTGTALTTLATSSVSATHDDTEPSHVTLEFDESDLKTYRPFLDAGDGEMPTWQYAWKATSNEQDTRLYQYWNWWPTQRAAGAEHYLDREPCYVLVDDATDDVTETWYSSGHWLKATEAGDSINLHDDTHPTFRLHPEYHHYIHESVAEADGEYADLKDLGPQIDLWLDEPDFHRDLRRGAAHNPWTMAAVDDWWAAGLKLDRIFANLWRRLNWRGFDDSDL